MSTPRSGDTAHTNEPIRKIVVPHVIVRFRPNRSAEPPATTSNEPNRIEYAVTTQEIVPRLASGNVRAISANATFTIDMSSVEMYDTTAHTANVDHGPRMRVDADADVDGVTASPTPADSITRATVPIRIPSCNRLESSDGLHHHRHESGAAGDHRLHGPNPPTLVGVILVTKPAGTGSGNG